MRWVRTGTSMASQCFIFDDISSTKDAFNRSSEAFRWNSSLILLTLLYGVRLLEINLGHYSLILKESTAWWHLFIHNFDFTSRLTRMSRALCKKLSLTIQSHAHRWDEFSLTCLLTSSLIVKCKVQLKWAKTKSSGGVFRVSGHTLLGFVSAVWDYSDPK